MVHLGLQCLWLKRKAAHGRQKGSTGLEDGERQQLEGTFLEDGSRVLKKGKDLERSGGGRGAGEMVGNSPPPPTQMLPTSLANGLSNPPSQVTHWGRERMSIKQWGLEGRAG